MKIVFDASVCGLGNNGGSRTIVKSCRALNALGHDASILVYNNQYTFEPIDDLVNYNKFLRPDAVVHVSISEVHRGYDYVKRFYWMRGIEDWRDPRWKESTSEFLLSGGTIIANSSWIASQFKHHVPIVFAGMDFDNLLPPEGKLIYQRGIGALQSNRKTKCFSEFIKLLHNLRGRHDYYSFGTGRCDHIMVNHIMLPTDHQKMNVYRSCSHWFAPTEWEGFHNVPAEACIEGGCAIVCKRLPANGMGDYATEETALRYSSEDELLECFGRPYSHKVSLMQEKLRADVGTREENMKKLLEVIG
jgi:hypothetical protein